MPRPPLQERFLTPRVFSWLNKEQLHSARLGIPLESDRPLYSQSSPLAHPRKRSPWISLAGPPGHLRTAGASGWKERELKQSSAKLMNKKKPWLRLKLHL